VRLENRIRERGDDLGDLVRLQLLPELPLDALHLVFLAQFQLLQSYFFQFFVVCEVPLLGE